MNFQEPIEMNVFMSFLYASQFFFSWIFYLFISIRVGLESTKDL